MIILGGIFLIVRSILYGDGRKPRFVAIPAVPEISLVHVHFEHDTAYVNVHCILENKSPFRLNIDSVYLNLRLGGELLVSESQHLGLRLKKKEKDSTVLHVKIPNKEVKKRIKSMHNQDSTDISIDAAIVYNTIIGSKSISIRKTHQIEVPVPPEFKVLGVRKQKIHLFKKQLDGTLFLEIQNLGKRLNVDVSEFHYAINIGDREVKAQGKLPQKVSIKPQTTKIIPIPGEFKFKTPLLTLGQILSDNDRLPLYLKLSGYVDSKKLKHIPVLVTLKGMVELRNEDKAKEQKKRIKNL